jgi:hypothetical protein
MPFDVKQAVAAAQEYARELYPSIEAVRLEEVAINEGEGPEHWDITLSFQLKDDPELISPMANWAEMLVPGSRVDRRPVHYKVFRIDRFSGQVRSMKIRKIKAE